MSAIALSDEHPLALEFKSLCDAVSHYQAEAHRATVQLQHHSLEYGNVLQRLHALENENSHLQTELRVHRMPVPGGSHRDVLQIQELTLALRRLSDKLDFTEKALLERNEELVSAESERNAARSAEDNAVEAAVRLRVELESSRAEERELMNRVKASEEQRKMSDLVVEEYASLVRSLEGRPSLNSQRNGKENSPLPRGSLDGLTHARQGLHKLLQDSNSDSEKLHADISRLHDALDAARTELEIEKAAALEDRRRLAQAQLELHQLKCDDKAAAKMVSRYMKFSQSSTDVLHSVIENLKTRQEALVASYEARLQQSEERIASEIRQSQLLRRALDELTEDISRESYGRRREVALRLRLLGREESLSERLRRWLLKSHEMLLKTRALEDEEKLGETFERLINEAQDLLSAIDNTALIDGESASSVARIYAAEATVRGLQTELQRETDRRLYFEYQLAIAQPKRDQPTVITPKSVSASLNQSSIPVLNAIPAPSQDPSIPIDLPNELSNEKSENNSLGLSTLQTSVTLQQPAPVQLSSNKLLMDHISPAAEIQVIDPPSPTPSLLVTSADDETIESAIRNETGDLELREPSIRSKSMATSPPPTSSHSELAEDKVSDETDKSGIEGSSALAEEYAKPLEEQPVDGSSNAEVSDPSKVIEVLPLGIMQISPLEQQHDSVESSSPTIHKSEDPNSLKMHQDERFKSPYSAALRLEEKPVGVTDTLISDPSPQDLTFIPLLSKLSRIDERYDDLQNAFRDCHLALQELKQICNDVSDSSRILNIATGRLSDYCDDARVELEIRISDEDRIAKGFQTLLSVPEALSDEVNEQDIIRQVEAFLDGSDPAVLRAQDMLKHKLNDLQHDIASLKLSIHTAPPPSSSPQDLQTAEEHSKAPSTSGWASWTGSILMPSRAPSPAPSFGAVMTSPRLRHSSSSQRLRVDSNNAHNPFASLGLRIPMPSHVPAQNNNVRPPSPITQRGGPRPRITSNVFGVGLRAGLGQGIRRSSLAINDNPVKSRPADIGDLDNDVE